MSESKNFRDSSPQAARVHWIRLIITLLIILAVSFALAFLLQRLVDRFDLPLDRYAWLAYLIVFGTALVSNLTIIAPVPFAVSIMVTAATKWNPVIIALVAATGGTLGEFSGYLAGYLGKKIAISDHVLLGNRVEHWIQRYGMWGISFLAFQPIIPFDIGGLVAGAARLPIPKFLIALWIGKFPKYVIMTYIGVGFLRFIPFLS